MVFPFLQHIVAMPTAYERVLANISVADISLGELYGGMLKMGRARES